ncbi:hypothetical protein BKA67DRAFT_8937 [Truncatella angustata]|uniref:Uncharacterized protein n=1 Tax=Truncatella angustata TaxID=152316 RepID=A0A9P8UW43_9PEZI|nr:uncharacterized protein BKA67DRAFT_8937 [Truncatella angustata]KAH6659258.1 hypothetical protein BKA67DRAFT_8937 [Truncatella angustata]
MYKHRFKLWGLAKYKRPTKEISTLQTKKVAYRTRHSGSAVSIKSEDTKPDGSKPTERAYRAQLVKSNALPLHASGSAAIDPRFGITSPYFHEESMYHAIKDYYNASFSSLFTWTEISPSTGVVQVKPRLLQIREQLQDLHSRFRIALNKLSGPQPLNPADLAEGIKILRVCFARFPDILAAEDPILISHVLDLIRRVQESGHTFIETQLRRHIFWLAKTRGQPRSTSLLSHALMIELPLDRYHRSLLTEIAVHAFQQYLGPYHFETLQLKMWLLFNREESSFLRGYGLRQLYSQLESDVGKDVFDDRHMDILMNLSSHYFRAGEPESALSVVNYVFLNPARLEALKKVPEILYNFYWLAGKALGKQSKHIDAEGYFRKALSVAQQKLDKNATDDSSYLSVMTALELNLRDQDRLNDADEVLAMRQAYIRKSLASVGEQESTG